ncbi:MAG: uroporphyrinogen decarboxylase family protein [Candidatus Sumerlaeia bacterium]
MGIYSEKENFRRVMQWNHPSHVSYPAPSKGLSYDGAWPADSRPSPNAKEWKDIWGVVWTDVDGEVFPTGPAIQSVDQVDQLQVPDPHDPKRLEKCRQALEEIDRDQFFVSVNHPYWMYEKAFNIVGAEAFLMGLLADPDNAHRLLDSFLDFELGIAREYVKLKPDHVNLSDDYGMQDRLAVSLDLWREYFKPRMKAMVDFYRRELGDDIVISHHSCGHVMPILEDLIEVGIDALNPIQTTANDLPEMRRITSGRLVLAGGIEGQHILPNGTPEEIRQEVFRKLDLLWEDGGYLPFPEKMLGVSPENKAAMEAAIREWSREHVEAHN